MEMALACSILVGYVAYLDKVSEIACGKGRKKAGVEVIGVGPSAGFGIKLSGAPRLPLILDK
jgi:hypothetical protein